MTNILQEISNAYCETSAMPVLWRMHPEVMYQILHADRECSYAHYDKNAIYQLCGLPVEIDRMVKGWQLFVECKDCLVTEDNFMDFELAVDSRGRCAKCHGANAVLEVSSNDMR